MSVEGEIVVDLWGGYADPAGQRPWREDTIVNVFSCSKTLTFLSALLLVEKSKLELDCPVADYWPEFGVNGKENILVRHVLTHSAGVPAFNLPKSTRQLYDWDCVVEDLAAAAPLWEPGTRIGYHAFTQGYLIGELVRRIDGRGYGRFLAEEITDPLQADFHVGLAAEHHARVADLAPAVEPPPDMAVQADSVAAKVFANMALTNDDMLSAAWRQAEIPAVNGHGNARSLVKTQSVLANRGVSGACRLLSAQLCAQAAEFQIGGDDLVLGIPLNLALGYALPSPSLNLETETSYLWWGGAGGSLVVVDPERRICFAYVMNRLGNYMLGDPRGVSLGRAVYRSLQRP